MNDFAKAAAVILAETAVAARRRRALETQKRADLSKYLADAGSALKGHAQDARAYLGPKAEQLGRWASNVDNAPMVGLLGGAAAGGLGGLALGAGGKRKKSPWATALTGALAGGATGLGVGAGIYGYNHGASPLRDGKTTPGVDAARQQEYNESSLPEQLWAKLRGTPEAKGDTFSGMAGRAAAGGLPPATKPGPGPSILPAAVDNRDAVQGTLDNLAEGRGTVGAAGMAGGTAMALSHDRQAQMSNSVRRFAEGAGENMKPVKDAPKGSAGGSGAAQAAELKGLYNRVTRAKTPFGGRDLGSIYDTLERRRMGGPGAPANPAVGKAFADAKLAPRTGGQRARAFGGRVGAGATLGLLPDAAASTYWAFQAYNNPASSLPPVDLPGGQP